MSLINAAATTATTSLVSNVLTFVWDHSGAHAFCLFHFEDNHESLKTKTSQLQALRDDVKTRVERDEANQLTRTRVVDEWLSRVQTHVQEADTILQEGSKQIELGCIGNCCPGHWWTCYRLGKKSSKKLKIEEELISRGNFDVVAEISIPSTVQIISESQTVGMDASFEETWGVLRENEVKIMGIFGMGGIGKTTLLKKLNNAFRPKADDSTGFGRTLSQEEIDNTFDVVIWVVVSNAFDIQNIQHDIMDRLGLAWVGMEDQTRRARQIFNSLSKKKFVLLLDDVWHPVKLEEIGIPFPRTHEHNSKVVFTTRLESVCDKMDCDKKFRVNVLVWDKAFTLFKQKLGQEAFNSYPELAKEIAEECRGLPLALITTGRAMASKKTLREWNHAINTLRDYASEFSGMEEEVLAILKFSYDSLGNDTVRNCFLYCSLYPEDYAISKDEIVDHWIGEGFLDELEGGYLDELEELNDARCNGYDIIGSLQSACLLETDFAAETTMKMHDVVRDMALWIGRELGKKKYKFLVQARLTQTPNLNSWRHAQRISMMGNDFGELLIAPKYPVEHLQTLLLQGTKLISGVATNFFQHMSALRVLNLSNTQIKNIPESIGDLLQLQYLNLSSTQINSLSREIGNLKNLRFLYIGNLPHFGSIPQGTMSSFSKLQLLDLYNNGFGRGEADATCYLSIPELECLEHLRDLGISIEYVQTLQSMCHSRKLSSCLKRLFIFRCKSLDRVELGRPSSLLGNMMQLEQVVIDGCEHLKELTLDCSEGDDHMRLLWTLGSLQLRNLPQLTVVCTEGTASRIQFKHLSYVSIRNCGALKDISWLVLAPVLAYVEIFDCKEVEEILVDGFTGSVTENLAIFSRLERLVLARLPKLKSICGIALPFPSLVQIQIGGCPSLKTLPFTSNSTKKPSLNILGATKWWNGLQWEDQTVMSSFQPFFTNLPERTSSSRSTQR